jgi:hypothetical protein
MLQVVSKVPTVWKSIAKATCVHLAFNTKPWIFIIWLVVSIPLKNISQLGWLFPIYGKIKNVPNHQPVLYFSHRPTWFEADMISEPSSHLHWGLFCKCRTSEIPCGQACRNCTRTNYNHGYGYKKQTNRKVYVTITLTGFVLFFGEFLRT